MLPAEKVTDNLTRPHHRTGRGTFVLQLSLQYFLHFDSQAYKPRLVYYLRPVPAAVHGISSRHAYQVSFAKSQSVRTNERCSRPPTTLASSSQSRRAEGTDPGAACAAHRDGWDACAVSLALLLPGSTRRRPRFDTLSILLHAVPSLLHAVALDRKTTPRPRFVFVAQLPILIPPPAADLKPV